MYYAKEGKISTIFEDGSIEITKEEYRTALDAMLNGQEIKVINDNLVILSNTQKTVYSIIDGSENQIPENDIIPNDYTEFERPSVYHDWNDEWVFNAERYLPAYRRKRVNEGLTVNGVTIQTDLETRTNLLGARELNQDIKWKTPNGFVDLTAAQIAAIATAVGEHVQKCFDAEAALDPADYDTIEELETAFDNAYNQGA